jgi:hypothetical protein
MHREREYGDLNFFKKTLQWLLELQTKCRIFRWVGTSSTVSDLLTIGERLGEIQNKNGICQIYFNQKIANKNGKLLQDKDMIATTQIYRTTFQG